MTWRKYEIEPFQEFNYIKIYVQDIGARAKWEQPKP
jgi:nitrous oxide reductase accessory protein NosL